jgi:glycosyltransferase involved in cell wall biosynthesis
MRDEARPLRILSIAPDLGRGGLQRAIETFTLCYQRAGHSVAVLGWRGGGGRADTLRRHGIPVFVGGPDLAEALAAADAFQPDVIHIHRVGVANPVETRILRRLRSRHRRVIETNVFGRVDRSDGADLIDVHMLLSDWCLWRWRRWLGSGTRRVGVVVPNPVDTSRFEPADAEKILAFRSALGIPPDAFVCGRIGQPDPVKWHRATFTAFGRLARVDPTAWMVLIGLPADMRAHIEHLPLEIRRRIVEAPGSDNDEELANAYSSFDCFLHAAAIGESFGYVLAEAMLCECPIVTASTPQADNSQLEVVTHMVGGLVAASPRLLPAALLRFRSDRDLRTRLKPRLRQHVISRFEAQAVADRALELARLALGAPDRATLLEEVSRRADLRGEAAFSNISRLLGSTFGAPSTLDLLAMRLRHSPVLQTAIDARLSRRLRRSDAMTLGREALIAGA